MLAPVQNDRIFPGFGYSAPATSTPSATDRYCKPSGQQAATSVSRDPVEQLVASAAVRAVGNSQ